MTVSQFVQLLIDRPGQRLRIGNTVRSVVGFAEYRTVHAGSESYYKVACNDHAALCLIPAHNQILFSSDGPARFPDIADSDIGVAAELLFRGKRYKLDNANDYQYVVRLITGDAQTIEGEVRFSDYTAVDAGGGLLSLGLLMRTGERADVCLEELSVDGITLT